jgi:hypothetical protein
MLICKYLDSKGKLIINVNKQIIPFLFSLLSLCTEIPPNLYDGLNRYLFCFVLVFSVYLKK